MQNLPTLCHSRVFPHNVCFKRRKWGHLCRLYLTSIHAGFSQVEALAAIVNHFGTAKIFIYRYNRDADKMKSFFSQVGFLPNCFDSGHL